MNSAFKEPPIPVLLIVVMGRRDRSFPGGWCGEQALTIGREQVLA